MELVPATLGGTLVAVLVAVLQTALALVRGLVDELLLFPATILSAALLATTVALSVRGSAVVVVVDLGATLIVAGMALVSLDRLVAVSAATPAEETHEQ